MRYKIVFSYDGSKYNGYQKQKGLSNTIQGIMEDALKYINNGKNTKLCSSGRTDKGVSAYMQVAHADIDVNITPYKLKRALNSLIPDSIYVKEVYEVDDNFHARYMVKEKTYEYVINLGEYNPIEKDYVNQLCKNVDIDKIKREIKYFIGTHDFSAFCSNEDKKEDSVRTIFDASISVKNNYLKIRFTGNGFLKYMVRIMVGYLIDVGISKQEEGLIDSYFDYKGKKVTTKTIAATGLYLIDVKY